MHFQSAFTFLLELMASVQDDGLVVPTQQGPVLGTQPSPGVRRFLGIPYAVAERWQPPQLPPFRNTSFAASHFGPSCPQAITKPIVGLSTLYKSRDGEVEESEDCLSVNVWAPSTDRKQGTAVLVWVYGGGYQIGTSNHSILHGQNLVQNHNDITVVTLNYRLNVLGWPNSPQLYDKSQPQNFGLLDVDAAVQWIYDNIAAFGGDPERIVLFGESAGATTIDAYTFANPQDKRVKGVIQQSGNILLPITGATTGTFDPAPWNTLAGVLFCGNVVGTHQLECMKAVPTEALIAAVVNNNLTFFPVADESTIFADTRERAEAGNYLRVPLLSGATAHEADIFVAGTMLLTYGHTIPVTTEIISDLLTQLFFACFVAQTANDRVQHGVPSWRYLYSGIFKALSPLPVLRAYHSSEIPIVFGTYPKPSSAEKKTLETLSKYVQGAWVAFARDPVNGLTEYGWPLYNPNTASVVDLGGFYNATGSDFVKGSLLDKSCSDMGALATAFGQLLPLMGDADVFY